MRRCFGIIKCGSECSRGKGRVRNYLFGVCDKDGNELFTCPKSTELKALQVAAPEIYAQALQALGLRCNSKEAKDLTVLTVGREGYESGAHKDPHEILAWAMEKEIAGKGNELTAAIVEVFERYDSDKKV